MSAKNTFFSDGTRFEHVYPNSFKNIKNIGYDTRKTQHSSIQQFV